MTTAATISTVALAAVMAGAGVPGAAAQTAAAQGQTGPATPTPSAQTSRPAQVGKRLDEVQGPKGFSVVLVIGDLQGGATTDNVPPAARKALADMRDFLPYKSYRLLDVQYTLCCSRGGTPMASRLKGPDDRDYDLAMTVIPDASRSSVRFLLREAWSGAYGLSATGAAGSGGSATGSTGASLLAERARIEQQIEAALVLARRRQEMNLPPAPEAGPELSALRARLAELNLKAGAARDDGTARAGGGRGASRGGDRSIIDTSFTMDIGETVVVGTSRLSGGDKALIALLTAVPRSPSSSR